MPDWDRINKRVREEAKNPSEKPGTPGDIKPSEESWSGKGDRLQWEREQKENARKNEPGLLKIGFKIKFHSFFGYFSKEARAERKKTKSNKQNEN